MSRFFAASLFITLAAGHAAAADVNRTPAHLLGEKAGAPVRSTGTASSTGAISGIRLSTAPFGGVGVATTPISGTRVSTGAFITTAPVRPIEQMRGLGGAGPNPQNTTVPGSPSNVDAPAPRSLSTDQLPRPGAPVSTESR